MARPFPNPGPNDVWGQALLDAIDDRTAPEAIEAALPTRLSQGSLNATYALKTDVPPTTIDGGNATSTYTGTFNFDGGSAA